MKRMIKQFGLLAGFCMLLSGPLTAQNIAQNIDQSSGTPAITISPSNKKLMHIFSKKE
jgi:hypothetical protein